MEGEPQPRVEISHFDSAISTFREAVWERVNRANHSEDLLPARWRMGLRALAAGSGVARGF